MVSFLKKCPKARIIQYVNYSIKKDPENYYRERLVLFYPWKNESVDLIAGSKFYEDSYKKKQKQIEVVCKEYEPHSDVLEEAIGNADIHEREDENINDDEQINTVSHMDKYAFFDPDIYDSLKNYDIGPDLPETYTRKSKPTCEKYETEVDYSGVHMNDNEYAEHMRTLNKKNNMNCVYMLCSN